MALGLTVPAWADLEGLGADLDGDDLGTADGGALGGDLDLPSENGFDTSPDDPLGVDASRDPVDPGLVDPAFDPGIPGGGDPDFDPELPGPGD
jgi:hypothetical protein